MWEANGVMRGNFGSLLGVTSTLTSEQTLIMPDSCPSASLDVPVTKFSGTLVASQTALHERRLRASRSCRLRQCLDIIDLV
jgi:hypothetical protein